MKFILLIAACFVAGVGHACPFCNSTAAKETRTVLLGPDLGITLAATVLPFIIFSITALLVYYWRFGKKRAGSV